MFIHTCDRAADGGFFHIEDFAQSSGADAAGAYDDGQDVELIGRDSEGRQGSVVAAGYIPGEHSQARGGALAGHSFGELLGRAGCRLRGHDS